MDSKKTYYAIGALYKTHYVEIGFNLGSNEPVKSKIDLTWADGMIGVMPVFRNKKSAQKFIKEQKNKFCIINMKPDASE